MDNTEKKNREGNRQQLGGRDLLDEPQLCIVVLLQIKEKHPSPQDIYSCKGYEVTQNIVLNQMGDRKQAPETLVSPLMAVINRQQGVDDVIHFHKPQIQPTNGSKTLMYCQRCGKPDDMIVGRGSCKGGGMEGNISSACETSIQTYVTGYRWKRH